MKDEIEKIKNIKRFPISEETGNRNKKLLHSFPKEYWTTV